MTLFLLMISPLVWANENAVNVNAEVLDVMHDKGYAVFKRNVHVIHAGMDMKSDLLEVYFAADEDDEKSDKVNGALKRIEARGKVKIKFEGKEESATGDKAVYSPEAQTMTLTGNVKLTKGENVLSGSTLVYNLKTRQISLKAGKKDDGRIKARLVPEK